MADRIRRGSEPAPWQVEIEELRQQHGLGKRDSVVIARSATASIWHTEKTKWYDLPRWRPSFGWTRGLYRGFARQALRTVLETGIDVAPHSAFFASTDAAKAWEYPAGRKLAAMLVLDASQAERSFTVKPQGADDRWTADTAVYPRRYIEGSAEVHTRFERGRGAACFLDEKMYGYWIPGDARAALIAVVLGGPKESAMQLLRDASDHVGVEFV